MQAFYELPFGIKEISDDAMANFVMHQMLRDFADTKKSYRSFAQWCLEVGVHPQDLDYWKNKHSMFNRAHEVCKAYIGEKRELEVLAGAPPIMATILPQYHLDWRKERDERAALKTSAEGKGQVNLTINVPKLPEEDK